MKWIEQTIVVKIYIRQNIEYNMKSRELLYGPRSIRKIIGGSGRFCLSKDQVGIKEN